MNLIMSIIITIIIKIINTETTQAKHKGVGFSFYCNYFSFICSPNFVQIKGRYFCNVSSSKTVIIKTDTLYVYEKINWCSQQFHYVLMKYDLAVLLCIRTRYSPFTFKLNIETSLPLEKKSNHITRRNLLGLIRNIFYNNNFIIQILVHIQFSVKNLQGIL